MSGLTSQRPPELLLALPPPCMQAHAHASWSLQVVCACQLPPDSGMHATGGNFIQEYVNATVPYMAFGEFWDTCEDRKSVV